jgi:hypothetical protein
LEDCHQLLPQKVSHHWIKKLVQDAQMCLFPVFGFKIPLENQISYIAFLKKKTVLEIFHQAILTSFRELYSQGAVETIQPSSPENDQLYAIIVGRTHTKDLIKLCV